MATDTTAKEIPQVLPVELRPCVDNLVTEDDTPVDNIYSEKQQRLLTEPLYSSWKPTTESTSFVAFANVGLFYAIKQPPYVPDMLLSLDVELPADLHPKAHRSYFVWEYGKPPDAVIEVVSNKEGGEDTKKVAGYARIGVRYYVIYDPERLLSEQVLRAFQLDAMRYREMDQPITLEGIGLELRLWQGRYEAHENTWLRWFDLNGDLVPTGAERAEQERQRAEQQQQRAERLAQQLRELGVDPDDLD